MYLLLFFIIFLLYFIWCMHWIWTLQVCFSIKYVIRRDNHSFVLGERGEINSSTLYPKAHLAILYPSSLSLSLSLP